MDCENYRTSLAIFPYASEILHNRFKWFVVPNQQKNNILNVRRIIENVREFYQQKNASLTTQPHLTLLNGI